MIEFQRLILGDSVRNEAFHEALKRVIKPGMVVADIGSGTGFLAFLARKLGAKECHLYEMSDLLKLSKDLARHNRIDHLQFIGKHSTQVRNPPQCDVVISETLGNYALEENMLETLTDAKRFLKPGGVMIPQKLTQFVAPVVSERFHKELNVWDGIGYDLDFRPAQEICFHNVYVRTVEMEDLLPEGMRSWDEIDFRADPDSVRSGAQRWTVMEPCTVYGFALWWDCELVPGVKLSTSPMLPPTHWQQLYLPVVDPMDVAPGQSIECRLKSDTRYEVKVRLQWDAAVLGIDGKDVSRQRMDMWKGYIG
jgi:predicted RNA methylase